MTDTAGIRPLPTMLIDDLIEELEAPDARETSIDRIRAEQERARSEDQALVLEAMTTLNRGGGFWTRTKLGVLLLTLAVLIVGLADLTRAP